MNRTIAALVAGSAILIAGCGSTANTKQAAVTTAAPITETTPTTQPTPTTEAATTVAPTTEAPTTVAPTTEAPTTVAPTTTAPAATPTSATVIVVAPIGLLGWWDGHAWIDSDATSSSIPVAAGTAFSEIGVGHPLSAATAVGVTADCETMGTFTVALDPPLTYQFDANASSVAVNATWPLQPRAVTPVELANPNSAPVVQAQLDALGIPTSPVYVVQAFSVDLDGDGVAETVITAAHPDATTATGPRAGWYEMVLLVRGDVTSVLAKDVHLVDDDSYPNGMRLRVDAIADLNGDGRMEIVVGDQEFEGAGSTVFEVPAAGPPIDVLRGGCGV